ncbi:alpha-2-macroglobulin-like [Spea bombifrons]|uniref:alpha-2-macroglobulin-like n=1 Tax=Spea bombifrons TaxID=233779 RepID=UPI00234A0FEB|nr:alpha-2-macroglobulin-like [Spea bombifrons]
MWPRVLYVGFLVLQISWTAETKLHYAVIFPAELRCLRPQLACFHIEGAEREVGIQLSLSTRSGNTTLIEKNLNQDSLFSCVPFQVPDLSHSSEEVATVYVSIQSLDENINENTKVVLKKERSGILIQTDKPVYKPGQTVKFRVISLKENLQPNRHQIATIELQDPQKNRIGQWQNVTLIRGIAEFSLPLSPEPVLGEYSIKLNDVVHTFSVEEYVLPKFEVILELPEVVLFNREQFPIKICGRYTYGKPVQGVYNCTLCRKRFYKSKYSDKCIAISGRLDATGCSITEVKTENLKLNSAVLSRSLEGTASVTEDGTGIQLFATGKSKISDVMDKISFVDPEDSYRSGMPYAGKLKVEDAYGNPLPDRLVHLTSTNGAQVEHLKLATDRNGHASFQLDNTTNWQGPTVIKVNTEAERLEYSLSIITPRYGFASLTLSAVYSKSRSFLKLHPLTEVLPCEGQQKVNVEYIIRHAVLDGDTKHLDLHYLLMSKGSIWNSGSIRISVESHNEDLNGITTFNLSLNADVSPSLRALVYIFLPHQRDIIADSATFKVQRCFRNKVSVGFSPREVLPGSDVSLKVRAEAGSLCGLRVVDQSVVLLKPEAELTADKVHSLFPSNGERWPDFRIWPAELYCFSSEVARRSFYPRNYGRRTRRRTARRFTRKDVDIYSTLKGIGLKILTSAETKKPADCDYSSSSEEEELVTTRGRKLKFQVVAKTEDSRTEENKIRTFFPETWLWELRDVGDSGSIELHHTAPDTITDWNAGAFCMGPSGFGLSSPSSLRTFQPFFVDVTLPYSVVRGESFTLKATVFNYLKQCIKVQATLKPSEELEEEPCADYQYTSCLCEDESKTFYWNLKASRLGEVNITVITEALDTLELCNNEYTIVPKQGSIDTLIKALLVQPGGVLEEKSHSSLFCMQKGDGQSDTETISLKVPENIVKDSERAYITVLGDLMGTAMQNLDRLLAMPYGCGEQNMVLFSPNIFILRYLEKTHQLNDEIQTKAKKFLESGYQRQLTYKHDDGSYSAFGKNDPEGNTWLTAFVVRSFNKARPYIFVDESHLNQSFNWLRNNRQDNGCFRSVGKLFNNAMKGGVDDEFSLSAYVTIALLESDVSTEDPLVRDALSCLRKAATDVTSVYTQALLAYTFTLAGETDLRQSLLEKLEEKAVRSDGQLHWERTSTSPPHDVPYWYRAPSAEVELTSYVLLTLLSGPTKDLGKASEIVNWLSKQQNPYGGFSSTQDTIVALQAQAKYAEATFSYIGDVTVTVRSKASVMEFHVDHTNRLLLQRSPLPEIPGEYSVSASGSGCVLVQAVLRYNVPPPRSDASFSVTVEIKPDQCPEGRVTHFNIHINAKYTGPREKSNMALIEVKMLSGFILVKSSVRELEKSKLIQRSDIQTDMVTLYLDELGHDPIHLSLTVEQDIEVKNLKPATVKVYDYYETGESAVAEYNSPCRSDDETKN